MPVYRAGTSAALLVFQSQDEMAARGPRIHLVDAVTGIAAELDRESAVSAAEVLKEPHLTYGAYLIGQSGRHAVLAGKGADAREFGYSTSILSEDSRKFLRNQIGSILVGDIATGEVIELRDELADCAWSGKTSLICLKGKYQERRDVVRIDLANRQKTTLYTAQGKAKLENFRLSHEHKSAVFTENIADQVKIQRLEISTNNLQTVADFPDRYIFDLALAGDGTIAARIVSSKREGEKLQPFDIWVSTAYADIAAPGYLLRLPALDSPGFFSGKGFRGVESFAFSPDASVLAILMSGENDCRMADEGGNLACRHDIYLVERQKPGLRRLTHYQITSANRLRWLQLLR